MEIDDCFGTMSSLCVRSRQLFTWWVTLLAWPFPGGEKSKLAHQCQLLQLPASAGWLWDTRLHLSAHCWVQGLHGSVRMPSGLTEPLQLSLSTRTDVTLSHGFLWAGPSPGREILGN